VNAEDLGEGAGVDLGEGRDAVAVAPTSKGLHSLPVRVLLRVVGDDNPADLDLL